MSVTCFQHCGDDIYLCRHSTSDRIWRVKYSQRDKAVVWIKGVCTKACSGNNLDLCPSHSLPSDIDASNFVACIGLFIGQEQQDQEHVKETSKDSDSALDALLEECSELTEQLHLSEERCEDLTEQLRLSEQALFDCKEHLKVLFEQSSCITQEDLCEIETLADECEDDEEYLSKLLAFKCNT